MPSLVRRRRARYRRRARRRWLSYPRYRALNTVSSSIAYINVPWQWTASLVIQPGSGHSDLVDATLLTNSGQRGTILKENSFRNFNAMYEYFRIVKVTGTIICGNIVGQNGIQMVELCTGWQRSAWYQGPNFYPNLISMLESGSSRRKISTGQNQIRMKRAIRASGLMEKGGWISTMLQTVPGGQDWDLDDYATGNVHDKLSPRLYFGVGVIPTTAPTVATTVQVSCYGNVRIAYKGPRYGATSIAVNKHVSFAPEPDDDDDDDDMVATRKNVDGAAPVPLTRQDTQAAIVLEGSKKEESLLDG